MKAKTYNETDLMEITREGEDYSYEFIADVAGDNHELFDLDNKELVRKLEELQATGPNDVLDPESSCLYAYFKSKKEGVAFLKKLSAYLNQKARLLDKALAY